jgi:hypothetical protein
MTDRPLTEVGKQLTIDDELDAAEGFTDWDVFADQVDDDEELAA